MRHRQHGGPHVEGEPLRAAHKGPPADIGQLFENAGVEPKALQANCACDPANARSDHDGGTTCHEMRVSDVDRDGWVARDRSSRFSSQRDNRRCGTATEASI